jgi:predicted PurR-regulated permease PerM
MRNVASTLPEAANRVAGLLGLGSMADLIKDGTTASAIGGLATRVIAWSTTIAGALGSCLLIVFGGIYLALDPRLYRDGLIKLVPPAIQSNVGVTLDDAGQALKRWLRGQVVAMLLVGVFTSLGLWLSGVPSAFALGVIAGLAEFVPIIGPILAAIPALLIASSQDLQTVALALAVLVVIQQVESNFITPLIADRMVSIAPAVGLFAVVAMGVLFGPLGLLLGFPLVVVIDVAVRRLYVHDTLGKR